MKRYLIIFFVVLGSLTTLNAQSTSELSIHAGAGISSLNYSVNVGDRRNGFGAQFGAEYRYALSYQWSIVAGWEFSLYRTSVILNDFRTSSQAIDYSDGSETFEFRNTIGTYEELQKTSALQIPIMLHYLFAGDLIYMAAGVKVGLPFSGKFSNSAENIYNVGYYDDVNEDYGEGYEFRGFGKFDKRENSGELKFKPIVFLAFEAGIKSILLNSDKIIYTSLYLDLGLNPFASPEEAESPFVSYDSNASEKFRVNSVIQSTHEQAGEQIALAGKIQPISVGVKIRFALGR